MPLLSLAIEEHRACEGDARHFDAVGSTDPRLRSPTVAPQSWPLVWCFLFWGFSLKSCTSRSAPGHAGTLGAVVGMSPSSEAISGQGRTRASPRTAWIA